MKAGLLEQGLAATLAKRVHKQLKNPVMIRVKKQYNLLEKLKNIHFSFTSPEQDH